MLAQQELDEGAESENFGAVDWISSGLRIEETKYACLYVSISRPNYPQKGLPLHTLRGASMQGLAHKRRSPLFSSDSASPLQS